MNRRQWIRGSMSSLLIATMPVRANPQHDALFESFLNAQYPNRPQKTEHVSLRLPALAENGNSVALTIEVDSPMEVHDYIQTIDVFAPQNPEPHLGRFHLSPTSGLAAVSTRIRLGGDQTVRAIAATSTGHVLLGGASIVVTEAACLDFLI